MLNREQTLNIVIGRFEELLFKRFDVAVFRHLMTGHSCSPTNLFALIRHLLNEWLCAALISQYRATPDIRLTILTGAILMQFLRPLGGCAHWCGNRRPGMDRDWLFR